MKPVDVGSSIGLDRLATWNEVICAISVTAECDFASVDGSNNLREVNSDFGGIVCKISEDTLWLAVVHEMPYSKSN